MATQSKDTSHVVQSGDGLHATLAMKDESARIRALPLSVFDRKRKADAIGRTLAALPENGNEDCGVDPDTKAVRTGRGSLTGWTTCPLCGDHSRKRYAMGRGIASHLHARHTPWNPNPRKTKKRRKIMGPSDTAAGAIPESPLVGWVPSLEEIKEWEEKILQILAKLESESVALPQDQETASFRVAAEQRLSTRGTDRNGKPALSYRNSLPEFIQAAADGRLDRLRDFVGSVSPSGESATTSMQDMLALLNTRDRHNSIAEHWAAGGGHLECLRYLVGLRQQCETAAIDVEPAQDDRKLRRRDGKTTLHYAARYGQVECIRFLLANSNCTTVDTRSGDGTTPLHLACFGAHLQAVRYLVEQGADVHATNDWGCGAAHWVAMTTRANGNEEELSSSQVTDEVVLVCQLLRNAGVSFATKQKQGHSPLHKACQKLNRRVVEWISKSADLTLEERVHVGLPDDGGHKPSEIWRSMGGDKTVADWMQVEMGW
jgi:Ankyrin repeats (3 copies)